MDSLQADLLLSQETFRNVAETLSGACKPSVILSIYSVIYKNDGEQQKSGFKTCINKQSGRLLMEQFVSGLIMSNVEILTLVFVQAQAEVYAVVKIVFSPC